MAEGWIAADGEGDTLVLRAGGDWVVSAAARLDGSLTRLVLPPARRVRLDLGAVEQLDTAGAFLVLRLERALEAKGATVTRQHVAESLAPLLLHVEKTAPPAPVPHAPAHAPALVWLERLGRAAFDFADSAAAHLAFLGLVTVTLLRALRRRGGLRTVSVVAQMERVGVSALAVVGLLSFVIGIVMAYQGAEELQYYGAQLLTVNLLALGILRELGVMLASVIVAGRSGSAFTAELGSMQLNEEIAALETLALDPVELLVLPRLFALVLAMPLIAFYANMMALIGGAILCWFVLGITLPVFTEQLHEALTLWSFWLGIIKAPFFGATIAIVGCREGLSVEGSAESLGRRTTRSVVHSIFLVIIIDAAFSVLFSWLGI